MGKQDFLYDDFYLSLTKLVGKPIKDIRGYIAFDFGDPTFLIRDVVFEDGTSLDVEGEHDFPYLTGEMGNFNDETLEMWREEDDE